MINGDLPRNDRSIYAASPPSMEPLIVINGDPPIFDTGG